jgi:hypothetical protein
VDIFVEWRKDGCKTFDEAGHIRSEGRDGYTKVLIILADFLLHTVGG